MPLTLDSTAPLRGEVPQRDDDPVHQAPMRVLVTGGNGFIGRHVADELADRGHEPVILDRRFIPHPHYETVLGDIRDEVSVAESVAHVDAVMHLAGVLGTQETIDNPYPAAETNIIGGLNILQAVRQYEVPAVYICVGNHWMENTYSITKTTTERFCRMFNQEHGTRITIMRALNAYGPGQSLPQPWGPSNVRKITPTFIAQALTKQPIEIYGDGEQIMDMVYVADVAAALVDGLHPDTDITITHEIGTGRPTTVNQIAQIVNETANGAGVTHIPMRPGEPENSVVCAQHRHPRAVTDLEQGIETSVEYFSEII